MSAARGYRAVSCVAIAIAFAAAFVVPTSVAAPAKPPIPSFDCNAAKTSIEHAICDDSSLGYLDREVADAYQAVLEKLGDQDRKQLIADQRAWLKERDSACDGAPLGGYTRQINPTSDGENTSCLKDIIGERVRTLRGLASQLTPKHAAVNIDISSMTGTANGTKLADFPATRQPFAPSLSTNRSAVCPAFLDAVRRDFFSRHSWSILRSGTRNWGALFYAETPVAGATWLHLNENTTGFSVHLDNVKDAQALLVQRYPTHYPDGAAIIWLKSGKPSQADLDQMANNFNDLGQAGWRQVFDVEGRYGTSVSLLAWRNQIFLLRDSSETESNAKDLAVGDIGLFRIRADGSMQPSCIVRAAPDVTDAPDSVKKLYAAFNNFIGNMPTGYSGGFCGMHPGLAWFGLSERQGEFIDLSFARPWELTRPSNFFSTEPQLAGSADWGLAFLRDWGFGNPDNLRIYEQVVQLLPPATDALAQYYAQRFGFTADQAHKAAFLAISEVIDASLQLDSSSVRPSDGPAVVDAATFRKLHAADFTEGTPSDVALKGATAFGFVDLLAPLSDQVFANADPGLFLFGLGNADVTKLLIAKHLDVNTLNRFGKTPLMAAAQSDNASVVKVLLDAHADVQAATVSHADDPCDDWPKISGRTALMYAAENASAPVIEMLVAAGADMQAKNSLGQTARQYFDKNTRVQGDDRSRIAALLSVPPSGAPSANEIKPSDSTSAPPRLNENIGR